MRLGARPRRRTDRASTSAPGLRYFGATSRQDGTLPRHLPAQPPPLGPHPGPAVLHPVAARGRASSTSTPRCRTTAASRGRGRSTRRIRPPLFPVGIDQFPGTIRFHDVGRRGVRHRRGHGDVAAGARTSGNTLGYRIEWNGVSIAYLSDHQQPYDGSFAVSDGARELAEGVDLLIHDSQYTRDEFGRSPTGVTAPSTTRCGSPSECDVRTLALFHHDPTRTDDAIDDVARLRDIAGRRRRRRRARCSLACEGLDRSQRRLSARSMDGTSVLAAAAVVDRRRASSWPARRKLATAATGRAQAAELGAPRVGRPSSCRGVETGARRAARRAGCSAPCRGDRGARRLLVAFTVLIVRAAASQGRHPPCACFGALEHRSRSGPATWCATSRSSSWRSLAATLRLSQLGDGQTSRRGGR